VLEELVVAGLADMAKKYPAGWWGRAPTLPELAGGFAQGYPRRHGHIKRAAPAGHGDEQAGIADLRYAFRHTRTFAAHHYNVPLLKAEIPQGRGGFGGHKNQAACALGLERFKGHMAGNIGNIGVIHRRAAQGFDRKRETARLYHVNSSIKAGGEANHCAQIRGNIGLKRRDSKVFGQYFHFL